MDKRLFIFTHLPKSAGSNLHKHIEKNVSAEERLSLGPNTLGIDDFDQDNIFPALEKYLGVLSVKKKNKVKFYYGHQSPYGVHELINKRKPFYMTWVRDPLKKIISLYNYYSGWFFDENESGKKKSIYEKVLLINGEYPTFPQWYKQRFKESTSNLSLNTNVEFFQKLGYMKAGKVTTKKMKDCLDKFDFVGLTKTFGDDSLYFYHWWGFNKFFVRQNVSRQYFHAEDHPQLVEKLKKDLSADYEFYLLAEERHQEFVKNHRDYKKVVEEMRQRRNAVAPFTQALFDWPDNFNTISSYLRKVLPGYGRLKDIVSGK